MNSPLSTNDPSELKSLNESSTNHKHEQPQPTRKPLCSIAYVPNARSAKNSLPGSRKARKSCIHFVQTWTKCGQNRVQNHVIDSDADINCSRQSRINNSDFRRDILALPIPFKNRVIQDFSQPPNHVLTAWIIQKRNNIQNRLLFCMKNIHN